MNEVEIKEILEHPGDRHWSIQGFGMLRLYLDDCHVKRLHIWDPDRANDEVSSIHDHPWDFVSEIISGAMTNVIYEADPHGVTYQRARIRCGEGGGLVEDPADTRLRMREPLLYVPGQGYSMHAEQLHESYPSTGTVSIITRTFRPDNTDIATVCWRHGEWVSAEPRPATQEEVDHFTRLALKHWAPVDETVELVIEGFYQRQVAEYGLAAIAEPWNPMPCACTGAHVGRTLVGMPCHCRLHVIINERAKAELAAQKEGTADA